MKLWRLQYSHDEGADGSRSEWFTSKRAAEKRLREVEREPMDVNERGYQGISSIQSEDVPTRKADLAKWLTGYLP
jgi:type II secretory pathway component PulF